MTMALALGFYAQFESGLPAYALTVLDVDETDDRHRGRRQLRGHHRPADASWCGAPPGARRRCSWSCGGIWVLSWLVLSAAHTCPGLAGALFVTTFGIFAVGETMYAPVLNPLTASLAPSGMVGTTLGVFGAIQTSGSAVGPLLAGVVLDAGHGTVFIVAARR